MEQKVHNSWGNPLVQWEEFIGNYPRDAIILHTIKKVNVNPPLTIAYDENTTVCNNRQTAPSDMLGLKKTSML